MNKTEQQIIGVFSTALARHTSKVLNNELTDTNEVFNAPGNVSIRLDGSLILVSFYETTICVLDIERRQFRLNTRNNITGKVYRTDTTKSRLNMLLELLKPGASIYQKGGKWFYSFGDSEILFQDWDWSIPLDRSLYTSIKQEVA